MTIRTSSKLRQGHRRAGQRHSSEPTKWPEGTFTAAQLKQLKADPNLVVEEAEEKPKSGGKAKDSPAGGEAKGGKKDEGGDAGKGADKDAKGGDAGKSAS